MELYFKFVDEYIPANFSFQYSKKFDPNPEYLSGGIGFFDLKTFKNAGYGKFLAFILVPDTAQIVEVPNVGFKTEMIYIRHVLEVNLKLAEYLFREGLKVENMEPLVAAAISFKKPLIYKFVRMMGRSSKILDLKFAAYKDNLELFDYILENRDFQISEEEVLFIIKINKKTILNFINSGDFLKEEIFEYAIQNFQFEEIFHLYEYQPKSITNIIWKNNRADLIKYIILRNPAADLTTENTSIIDKILSQEPELVNSMLFAAGLCNQAGFGDREKSNLYQEGLIARSILNGNEIEFAICENNMEFVIELALVYKRKNILSYIAEKLESRIILYTHIFIKYKNKEMIIETLRYAEPNCSEMILAFETRSEEIIKLVCRKKWINSLDLKELFRKIDFGDTYSIYVLNYLRDLSYDLGPYAAELKN